MTYKMRNISVLLAFIFLISAFSAYLLFYFYPKRIDDATLQLQLLQQRTTLLEASAQEFEKVKELVEEKEVQYSSIEKVVLSNVSAADTYDYLVAIINRIGFLQVNMTHMNTLMKEKSGHHVYHIRGEGSFTKIFSLIWYLERGAHIYTIRTLSMRGIESSEDKSRFAVPFQMEIWAHFSPAGEKQKGPIRPASMTVASVSDPFRPLIKRSLPPNTGKLVEVERAQLRAIVAGKALLADGRGKIHSLEEGAEVYLGYLSRINPAAGEVEFTLNKGGIVQKVVLRMEFDNQEITRR